MVGSESLGLSVPAGSKKNVPKGSLLFSGPLGKRASRTSGKAERNLYTPALLRFTTKAHDFAKQTQVGSVGPTAADEGSDRWEVWPEP